MTKRLSLPLALTAWACFSGCSTPAKDAYTILEQGRADDAVDAFDRILHRDPGDPESQEGLRKARETAVAQRLARARTARLENQTSTEIDWAAQASERVRRWKLDLPMELEQALLEESRAAVTALSTRVSDSLRAGFPLRALQELDRYAPSFEPSSAAEIDSLRAKVTDAGAAKCEALSHRSGTKGLGHLASLLAAYCRTFGEPARELEDREETAMKEYFRATQTELNVSGLPHEQVLLAGEALHKALERTPWFDHDGLGVLHIAVGGKAVIERSRVAVPLEHAYKREGRDEVFRHNGWKHDQTLELSLTALYKLGSRRLALSMADRASGSGIEHHDLLPKIGLAPSAPDLPDPQAWMNERIRALASQFETRARTLWKELYCPENPPRKGFALDGEAALRCYRLAGSGEVPGWVSEWHLEVFGVPAADVHRILGLDQKN